MKRKRLVVALIACILLLQVVTSGTGFAASVSSGLQIQCVSDQHSAVPGGEVGYHILYQNVQTKLMSKAWMKVNVPKGLELNNINGAEWDAASGTLKWNLNEVAPDGAGIIHFSLKVNGDVAMKSILEVSCSGGMGNEIFGEVKKVSVIVGTEIQQPVFNGYPDGKFHPERQLTRAETAAIVARVEDLPAAYKTTDYKDVAVGHWAYGYIQKVTASGYMNGDQGAFRPDEPISRAELIVLMLRVKGIQAIPMATFIDSKLHWAKQEIGTSRALQYIDGQGMDIFNPDGFVIREDASKLLAIMLYRGELKDGDNISVIEHWPDVPKNRWSFGWIEGLSLVAHESKNEGFFIEKLVRYLPEQTKPL
jgi:hypothetical protein